MSEVRVDFVGGPIDGDQNWIMQYRSKLFVGMCGRDGAVTHHRYKIERPNPESNQAKAVYDGIGTESEVDEWIRSV